MPATRRYERRATAAEWTSVNPILGPAEIGVETDTLLFKLGDGVTAWVSLDYAGGGGAGSHPDLATHDALGLATDAALATETAARTAADALLIPLTQKGAASGVATLDGSSKIPSSQIPALALSEFLGSVASEAAMWALTGQRGDWAVRTDLDPDSVFLLETDDPTQIANWTNITGPGAVLSVNGETGAVSLVASEIPSTATGDVAATNVQAAIAELAAEKSVPQLVSFLDDINAARPVTNGPVGWVGGAGTPTNIDEAKEDFILDLTDATIDGGTPAAPDRVVKLRGGTAAQWASANPVVPARVLTIETDTLVLKIGDGTTAYASLTQINPAVGGGGGASFSGCRATRGSNQSIPDNTATAVAFTEEDFDVGGWHDTVTNNSRFTNTTGSAKKVVFSCGVAFFNINTGRRFLNIRKNGATPYVVRRDVTAMTDTTVTTSIVATTGVIELANNDYLEAIVLQNSGSARDLDFASHGDAAAWASIHVVG